MKSKFVHSLGPLFGLILFAGALWVLHHELRAYHLQDILRHMEDLPRHRIAAALLFTALSYFVMTGYDVLALRYIRNPLPYRKTALASFVSYAFSNNIGLSMVAGGSVRYRLYSSWGLSGLQITKVVVFCILTLWLGFMALGGTTFLLEPVAIPGILHLPFTSLRLLGGILLAPVLAYFLLCLLREEPLVIRAWEFSVPSVRFFLAQMLIGLLDWTMAGSALYALLPPSDGLSWAGFMGLYLLAQFAGLMSQVPGGLGIFETVMIVIISPYLPGSEVLGSLLAYRGVYYLLPLLVATLLLGAEEVVRRRALLRKVTRTLGPLGSVFVPNFLAVSSFVGGAILLFSGALPSVNWRLTWLRTFVPLPVIEISHFLGSVVGTALLLLARGLQRRIDAAFLITAGLLSAGILFSLLKGFDYEEAAILSLMLTALLPCRRYFYRKGSLVSERFRPGWVAAVILVLLCSVWLGFFSYRHVAYSKDLWWRFTLHGDAPRFLREMVGALGFGIFFALARLLRPAAPAAGVSRDEELGRIMPIVQGSAKTYASLALLGDKAFLVSESGRAFVMYGVQGRSWVGMGDPVGPEEEWPELVWRFREMCDRYDGWTVFYEVGPGHLPLYVDLGLTFLKLGEEARVPLGGFSLEGSARKGLRYTNRRFEKEGYLFQVIPAQEIPSRLPELKGVSDAWLAAKRTREKGFSLGSFNQDYLKRFPAGCVFKEGKMLAFANIWSGAGKAELSIDLMRHLPESPSGVMEYLFIQLMLWAKQEGYGWFSLGMAPLSGLEGKDLAPLWNRLGAFLYRHGEHFHNLQGLRRYKEKFDPEWQPRYLASPGGLATPRILGNVASLISGGLRGVVSK